MDEGEGNEYNNNFESHNEESKQEEQMQFESGGFESEEIEVTKMEDISHNEFSKMDDVLWDVNNKKFKNVFRNEMKQDKKKEEKSTDYDKYSFQEHAYEGNEEDESERDLKVAYPSNYLWFDDNCPPYTEVYAGLLRTTNTPSISATTGLATNYDSMVTTDMKVRSSNRNVYYTGYYDHNNQLLNYQSCFLVTVDEYGQYVSSAVLTHPQPSKMYSECYGIALTEDDKVVAVGVYYNAYSSALPSGVFGSKTSALIVYTDLTFASANTIIKTWSGSLTGKGEQYVQVARDVATTSDGSIYITGYNGGWSSGGQLNGYDCFVVRLNSTLEMVYARSFGSNLDEQCYSIQVSRNFDYIYLAGNQLYQPQSSTNQMNYYRLVFFKMTGYSDYITYSRYVYTNTLGHDLKIKRIMATNPRGVFSGGVDSVNQYIYFCASYYDGTQYDWIYGQLSYQLVLNYAFKYGAPTDDDVMGDCALTNDGRFLIGSFGTSHYQARTTGVEDIENEFVYELPYVADYPMPFEPTDPCYTTTCYDGVGSGCCVSYNYFYYPCCNAFCTSSCYGDYWYDGYCCCCVVNTQTSGDCPNIYTGTGTCSKCYANYYYTYYEIINTQFSAIKSYCRTELASTVQPYLDDYNDNIYSWHTCRYYTFDWNSIDCSVSNLRFTQCPVNSGDYDCSHACNTLAYQWQLNAYKPWYEYTNNGYTYTTNGNNQFIWDFWYNYLCLTVGKYYTWLPYQFCSYTSGAVNNDLDMIFEQDCEDDYDQYSDFFIFKIDLTTMSTSATYYDYQPSNAVYFGMYDGDEQPTAMAVDEFGYIYVAGTTNSVEFGMNSNVQYGMLYIKTHWDLNIELTTKPTANPGDTPEVVSESYLKARFVTPKKFRNKYYNSANSVYLSYGVTFMSNFLGSTSGGSDYLLSNTFVVNVTIYPDSDTARGDWRPYMINEMTSNTSEFKTTTHYTYADLSTTYSLTSAIIFAKISMSQPYTNYINKNQYYEFQLNRACYEGLLYYLDKSYFMTVGALATNTEVGVGSGCAYHACIVNTTDYADTPYFIGTISSASTTKGVYYLDDYMIASASYVFSCSLTINSYYAYCPYTSYYNFIDYNSYESLKRFQWGIRIKFVLEDLTISTPTILKNIPDQTPTCGQWTSLTVTLATYFTTSTECIYLKAKQGVNTGSGYAITKSTMLPYWINFYEGNLTFVMYPPLTAPTIAVQLSCCNNIDNCVQNTFYVTPQNSQPTLTTDVSQAIYILQYDATTQSDGSAGVGQHFTWSKNSYMFADADQDTTSTTLTNDVYNHMSQTVWLTYTGALTQFKQVDFIGMIYGQTMSTSTFTTTAQPQSMPFKFYDQYMYSLSNTGYETGYFYILMNRLPQYTTIGTLYTFSTLDPMAFIGDTSGIFGQIFPWLKTSPTSLLYVDTSQWFTDKDSDTLTYSCTYSDGTALPSWLYFNQLTGELTVIQYATIPSEYMNLRITAYDTKEGSYSYYKTLLVDTAPEIIVPHLLIYAPVGKQFSYYIGDNIIDQNGDYLSLAVSSTASQTLMTLLGIDFSDLSRTISGKIKVATYVPSIQIQATDPYGLYNTIFVSIVAVDLQPIVRSKANYTMPDQTLTMGYNYYFEVPKSIFYDSSNGSSLLMYATTPTKTALPNWIHFNPYSYGFAGVPLAVTTQQVLVTVMNPVTQQTTTLTFKITVLPNNNPKTNVKYFNQDQSIIEQTWFESTVSIVIFNDYESNSNAQVLAVGSNGQSLPTWLKYNKYNKTIYGFASTPGVYVVDFIYTDDDRSQFFAQEFKGSCFTLFIHNVSYWRNIYILYLHMAVPYESVLKKSKTNK